MPDKPNILVIWGDEIGISNLSCYGDGRQKPASFTIDQPLERMQDAAVGHH